MGGDTVSVQSSITEDDDDYDDLLSSTVPEYPDHFSQSPTLWSSRDYAQVVKSYDDLKDRVENIEVDKNKVLSYTPGSWVGNIGGMTVSDYNVPKTTTLLLIGPKGSGKSSLVNKISRVFEDDKFAPERAQVTYNSSIWDGTCFLQEYMVPRDSTSFCFYDTPGFSNDLFENLEMIKQWMTKGVRHGELVNSALYSSSFQARTNDKSHQDRLLTYERRRVDFVIFVVNGLSVLKCMENSGADSQYMQMVSEVFRSPSLSFKDHKPAIAITHGDLLSISERARVRVYLGDTLGVHPSKQTFDIPDNCDPITELTIVDLVRYALEHADRNLLCKSQPTISKGSTILLWTKMLLLLAVGILMFTISLQGFYFLKHDPESINESSLEIKKVTEFDQESVFKQDLGIEKPTEIHPEIVPEPTVEIKKNTELNQGGVPESDPDIKKVMKFDQESVPKPDMGIKKVTEIDPEIVPVPIVEIKKVTEFDQGIVSKSDLEIKKVTEFDQDSFPEPDMGIKKVTEIDSDIVPVPTVEIKKVKELNKKVTELIKKVTVFDHESVLESDPENKIVTEINPGIVLEHILEMKKVFPGSILKPSKKTKKGDAERSPGKKQKMKKVHAPKPQQKIDWKMIRHLWYEEPNQEIDWKTIRHLWYDL